MASYSEHYEIRTTRHGVGIHVDDLYDMDEAKAVEAWIEAKKSQKPGTRMVLTRVMTVNIASSIKA